MFIGALRPKRRLFFRACAVVVAIIALVSVTVIVVKTDYNSEFRVVYSLDRRQNDQEIVRLVNDARQYVYFAIYYFTLPDIADALIRAKARGVAVSGIMDAAASIDSNKVIAEKLRSAGVPFTVQKHLEGIMHVKAVVTDRAYASGSYNWTDAATEANDEVLEIGTNESVRGQYLAIIKKILANNK